MAPSYLTLSIAAAVSAALLSAALTWAIRPLMMRIALAKPNARSSHRIPTPQGGGIAVIAATLVSAATVIAAAPQASIPLAVFAAALFIAAVGFADDVKPVHAAARFMLQGLAVATVIVAAPETLRIVPACPFWLERALLFVAGLWFVNLVNFMDGLDLMTAAEIVPITAALVLIGWLTGLPPSTTLAAAALCGAMLGFVPFNRPVAKIFLGDVGSLPIGLLTGWCLLQLAWHQHVIAAVLLPLYYLADATITLFRRIVRREPFWAAHRSHYYQRATDNGFSVWRVVSEVFALNLLLAALAIGSILTSSTPVAILLLAIGGIATLLLLRRFSQPRPTSA